MLEHLPSQTACFVALARAVYGHGPAPFSQVQDPFATGLLYPPFSWVPELIRRFPRLFPLARFIMKVTGFDYFDSFALRTLAIDDALREALLEGVTQVVILGAGLDARAFRLPELEGCDVYELDHPATQGYKAKRLDLTSAKAKSLALTPINFERQRLGEVLGESPHDPSLKTLWIWEGVTMYLQPASIAGTLGAISEASHPGSRLITTYIPPDRPGIHPIVDAIFHRFLGLIGEPMVGLMEPEEFRERLKAAGFDVLSDQCTTDWAQRYWPDVAHTVGYRERFAISRYNPNFK